MSGQTNRIGILGVGNLLLTDEGFGIHFIQQLAEKYTFPPEVELLDGGTAGIMLAPFMEDKDILFVVDVVNVADNPGSIYRFSDREVRSGNIVARMSPHQVGLLEILDLCRLRDRAPDRVEMLTVVPGDLSTGIGLSPPLARAMDTVMTILIESLREIDLPPVLTATTADA